MKTEWLQKAAMILISFAITGTFLVNATYSMVNHPDSELSQNFATLLGATGFTSVVAFFLTRDRGGDGGA